MIIVIYIMLIIVYCNMTPFLYSDTYGHYLRLRRKYYIYTEKDIFGKTILCKETIESEVIKEKCNPWLMWAHMVKIKPRIEEYEFDSEETKKKWEKLKY